MQEKNTFVIMKKDPLRALNCYKPSVEALNFLVMVPGFRAVDKFMILILSNICNWFIFHS
jgi:hypothetical protein